MYPFYYSRLSQNAKKVYDTVFPALFEEKLDIDVDLSALKKGELNQVIVAILDDHPEITLTASTWCWEHTPNKLTIKTPIVSLYKNKADRAFLYDFERNVSSQCFTEYDKVKYVHDFIINSIAFDHEEVDTHISDRNNHHAIGAIYTGKSVCEGIARLAQLLLHICRIQAIYCCGRTLHDNPDEEQDQYGHAWIVVCINGKYYHMDVSHDVCLTKNKSQKEYCYFNLTHDDITKDHIIDLNDEFQALPCVSTTHNYYHYNNCFFSSVEHLSAELNKTIEDAILHNRSDKYYQFKVSDELQRQYNIPWSKICLSTIYDVLDRLEEKYEYVGIGFDDPYHNDTQGVFSINFTFVYD